MVQTGERPQTNGQTDTHTHGQYQTYYLLCYVVDNKDHLDQLLTIVDNYRVVF